MWEAFKKLKEALTFSPVVTYPQPDRQFILDTDTINESFAAVLLHEIDGHCVME